MIKFKLKKKKAKCLFFSDVSVTNKKLEKKRLRRRTAECTLYFHREYFLSMTYSLLHIRSMKGETNELCFLVYLVE